MNIHGIDFRFKTFIAKEIIQETLHKHLKDKDYSQIKAEDLSKTISSEIKDRLRGKYSSFILCNFCLMVWIINILILLYIATKKVDSVTSNCL